MGGKFKVSYGGATSHDIMYDSSANDLAYALNRIGGEHSDMIDVMVSRTSLPHGYRYLITFISPVSDVQLLQVDDTDLTGFLSSAKMRFVFLKIQDYMRLLQL